MGAVTGIEWTQATWNPVRGCTRVSAGCVHCYAEAIAARFSGPGMPYEGLAKRVGGEARWTGKVRLIPEHLADPLSWKKPRRIFVNSMSDLFHEGLPFDQIAAVFGVMAAAPQHAFQVLTKRPERALEFFAWLADPQPDAMGAQLPLERVCDSTHHVMRGRAPGLKALLDPAWPLPSVWLGVSVEDQNTADERIPLLLQCPAAVRFVSYEPALGPVDFVRWLPCSCGGREFVDDECWSAPRDWDGKRAPGDGLIPCGFCNEGGWDREVLAPRAPLNWVIVGGESGPGARPFNVGWMRGTIEQCRSAGVAVFCKQVGADPFFSTVDRWADDEGMLWPVPVEWSGHGMGTGMPKRLRDRKGGDWSEWPEDLRVREFPATRRAS